MSKPLPLVRDWMPWKAIFRMAKDPMAFLSKHPHESGIYRIDAPVPFVVVTGHEHIRHVLKDNWRGYEKGPVFEGFSLILGNGLLNSEGSTWKRHRKMIQPAFNKDHVQSLTDLMSGAASDFADMCSQKKVVEMRSAMLEYSLEVIARVMMGKSLAKEYGTVLLPLISEQCDYVMKRNRKTVKLPLGFPLPANIRYKRKRNQLNALVQEIIAAKKLEDDETLLSMMIRSTDEDGQGFTEEELLDEFLTLFVTGFETAGSALAWTMMLLARHPEIQEKMAQELLDLEEGKQPRIEPLMRSTWLNAVIKESLRLYPPAWIVARRALEDDNSQGFHIPKGSRMFLCIYAAHRNPRDWEDPDTFRPERFIEQKEHAAYLPFGTGPRMCIGNHFSQVELLTILYTICTRFRIELATPHEMEMDAKIALQPKGDVQIRLMPRK